MGLLPTIHTPVERRDSDRASMPLARRQSSGPSQTQTQEESEPLAFIWFFAQQKAGILQRCAPIEFQFQPVFNNATGQTVPYQLPFTFIGTPVGGSPLVLPAVTDITGNFTWDATFTSGTQFLISFVDAAGNPGGTGPLYTISGDGPCPAPPTTGTLAFSLNTESPLTCTSLSASVSGGLPPYTMSVFKTADRPVNMTTLSDEVAWVNTLSSSGSFIVGMSDALGNTAVNSEVIYSMGGSNVSCLISHTSGSHEPGDGSGGNSGGSYFGAIIGGAVGGAALLSIVLLLFWWYKKKRQSGFLGKKGLSLNTDLPGLERLQRHIRLPSISSTEKLHNVVGSLRSSDSAPSPVSSPLDERAYTFGTLNRSGSRRSQSSFTGPDFYTAVASRTTRDGSGTYRTVPSTSQGLTVRQHEDAGQALIAPAQVVELPPSYGAFSGSADMAAAADLAAIRPKGHTGATDPEV